MSLDIKIFKKRQKSPLDLNELFPNYFNKKVFRTAIIFMLILLLFTLYTNDWRFKYKYVECPSDSPTPCLYSEIFNYSTGKVQTEYLEIGEIRGVKPNEHGEKFNGRVYIIVLLSFIINHLVYSYYYGKLFHIPLNKTKWRSIKKGLRGLKNE